MENTNTTPAITNGDGMTFEQYCEMQCNAERINNARTPFTVADFNEFLKTQVGQTNPDDDLVSFIISAI